MLALIRGKTFHEFHRPFVSNHHKESPVLLRSPKQESMPEMQVVERAKHKYSHRDEDSTLCSPAGNTKSPVVSYVFPRSTT